jgi:hypothetical protein
LRWFDGGENSRVERDRDQGSGQDQALSFMGQETERYAEPGENEGEFADLRETRAHRESGVERIPQHQYQPDSRDCLAEHDDREHAQESQGLVDQNLRLEQHAHGYEEQNGKRITKR